MNEEKGLKSFEEQLKKVTSPQKEDSLKSFEDQLKRNVVPSSVVNNIPNNQQNENKTLKVVKNLVLSFVSDPSGCGHIRNVFPMMFFNSVFARSGNMIPIVTSNYITQQDMLARAKTLYFQRQMAPEQLSIVRIYKNQQQNLKYKMVWDLDDFIWGLNEEQGGTKYDGVPTYNFGAPGITKEVKQSSVEIMKLMDTCCFSTQYLRDYAKNTFNLQNECVVVPNAIPKFFWGEDKKKDITEKIIKPRVLYNGSPTHYHNVRKLAGDFDNNWRHWVIEAVKENKIDFIVMGGLPWFFEGIKDKIKIVPWVDSFQYHNEVKKQNADIVIMPLVPNNFNHSKSDIKYLECCAIGAPAIGTTFTNGKPSPYDVCQLKLPDTCSIQDIQNLVDEVCEPELYNKVKNNQYDWMDTEGRWLESQKYVNHFVKILMT
jgi:hypothetical protein